MTLRNLPGPVKVLYTCILITIGTGYLFAVTYLFLVDVQPHAAQGVGMVQAVTDKYYGKRDMTALESSLYSGMGDEITVAEKDRLLQWLHAGAKEEEFEAVAPILTETCAACHNHEDMPGAPLTNFEEISAYTQMDMGTSAKTLVRVSHIHVFGMTFIFTIVSGIFVQSEARGRWRGVIVAIPFVAIWFDIGSWWFTRLNPFFAHTVIVGGGLVGMSMAIQLFLSFYEMWLLPRNAATSSFGNGGMYHGPMQYPQPMYAQPVAYAPV